MIELEDITKIYPMGTTEVRALNGVSLHVGQGASVAIMGASGSGKSTLMHLVGCLDRPTSGTYRLLGETISGLNDRQLARIRNQSVGFVFQTFNLISRMPAWENVAVPLFYARQTVTKPQALAALDRVGLADRAGHQPNELSGGERQRVAIARAIVNQPRLILADEPTGNLDTRTGEQIMQIFHDLHATGTTIVLVTHERDIAEQALRIVAMRDGKIVEDRPSERARQTGTTAVQPPVRIERPPPVRIERPPPQAVPEAATGSESQQARAATDRPAEAASDRPEAILHPSAKRALTWALLGPVCIAALWGWGQLCGLLKDVNPGFIKTAGPALWVVLAAMVFIAPILGLIHGRRGARWVRLAPARFTGLRRARVAQWVSGVYLVLLACFVSLMVLAFWMHRTLGGRPG
ncbi:MAG TPA: ABC transporter ATP-binding protein [Phycisphaerae bacterium]|nr:ABC transporter ATP-binding protein [Phycisphaerae bacterium]